MAIPFLAENHLGVQGWHHSLHSEPGQVKGKSQQTEHGSCFSDVALDVIYTWSLRHTHHTSEVNLHERKYNYVFIICIQVHKMVNFDLSEQFLCL